MEYLSYESEEYLYFIKAKTEWNEMEKIDICINWIRVNKGQYKVKTLRKIIDFILSSLAIELNIKEYPGVIGLFPKNSANQTDVKKFFSVIIRVFSVYPEILEDERVKFKLLEFIEANFMREIYNNSPLPKLNYEKMEFIERYVSKIDDVIDNITKIWASPIESGNITKDFMALYNDIHFRIPHHCFLPTNIINSSLKSSLSATSAYLEADKDTKYEAFEISIESVRSIIDTLSISLTSASQAISTAFKNIEQYIRSDFEKQGYARPAQITYKTINKKYPLSIEGKTISLNFAISNFGGGRAFDVNLYLESDKSFSIDDPSVYIGTVEGNDSIIIYVKGIIKESTDLIIVEGVLSWNDYVNRNQKIKIELMFEAQSIETDWEKVSLLEPYTSEPIDNEEELMGRSVEMRDLKRKTLSKNIGSYIIHGQKRVGKTSIVRTLQHYIKSEMSDTGSAVATVFLETGSVRHDDAKSTIDKIVKKICLEIKKSDKALSSIIEPVLDGSLSPLDEFLSLVLELNPDKRLMFIMDEFDELPQSIYKKSDIADSFFLTIRSISNISNFGFILVGGEKMQYLMNFHGDKLNKFGNMQVDYFPRNKKWEDFIDLIRKPVKDTLEVTDEAIDYLYSYTAGNPFFTKIVCRNMYEIMTELRENHVAKEDMRAAIARTIDSIDSKVFSHFWEDGILERPEIHEEISLNRKRLVVSMAECHINGISSDITNIEGIFNSYGWNSAIIAGELNEFMRRGIVNQEDGVYFFRVRLLTEWLVSGGGASSLFTSFMDENRSNQKLNLDEELRVKSHEIAALCKTIGTYKGRQITEDSVRTWLNQFGAAYKQRLMFKLLQNIKYYSQSLIREKMRESSEIILRGLIIDSSKKRLSEIVVTYFGGAGKSGVAYARLFGSENNVYVDNIVEPSKLTEKILSLDRVQVVVVVDDFLGTGESAEKGIRELHQIISLLPTTAKIRLYFVGIVGTTDGIRRLENLQREIDFDFKICDTLNHDDKCFSPNAGIFRHTEIDEAKTIAFSFGSNLRKGFEMGYKDSQALVVFDNSCPNNCPVILWYETKNWHALFPR